MHISLDSALGRQRRLNSVGESVLQIAPDPAAAYSLRSLTGGDPKVVRVRRSALSGSDNEIDFTASEVSSGALTSFVTEPVSTLLNSAYYFSPDSHSHVDFDSDITLADGETMSLKYFFDGVTGTDLLFDSGGASANAMLITTSIAPRVRINSESIDFGVGCKLLINQLDTLTIARSGNDITITTGTGAVTKSFTSGAFTFNRLGGTSSQTLQGVFYNLQIGSRHNYTGLGGAATAWNDTVGSNNGTPDNLVSFTGQTVHGFVDTWYDQSGSGNDAEQATAGSQPKIVSSGSLVVLNNVPALSFNGSSDLFTVTGFAFSPSGDFLAVTVSKISTGNLIDTRDGGSDGFFLQQGSSDFRHRYNGDGAINVSGNDQHIVATSELNGTTLIAYKNRSSSGTDTVTAGLSTTQAITIGRTSFTNGNFTAGSVQEIILYDTDKSANRAALEANIMSHYGIS